MDPLSVAASIAGLVSLGDTIFRKLYHYVKDVKGAEKEVLTLKNEIAELNGVLHHVHLIAEDLESNHAQDYSIRPGHVNACLATLYRLETDINKIGLGNKKTLRNKMQKLTWPSKVVDLKQVTNEIREHRNNLSFALSADSMTALLKCLCKQDELLQGINDVEAMLREKASIETRIAVDKERQSILDSFLYVNPQEIFQTSFRLRHPTTGFWLTESDTFTGWVRETGNHLWLSGIPGAGKTVLSSLVIQRCLVQATQRRAVAFFYCDYKDKKSQNMVNILGTLISQLARQNEQSFLLLQAYAGTLRPQNQLPRNPEVEELVELCKKIASTFEDVRIVVDGLDECSDGDGDGAAEVSRTLRSLADGNDIVSLCCLSRDEVDIRETFHPSFCDHIEIAAHSKDLEHYVRTEIEDRVRTKKLRVKSNDLKDEIINQLVKRANGMFRWVACQLDHLCTLPTDARRRQALAELPSTLHETYERLLYRIHDQDVSLVTRTLQWIAYATPKLRVEELVEVVSIDEYATEIDPEACPDIKELLRLCGSLIRRTNHPFESLELAHFTVLEFLEAISPDDTKLKQFRLCGNAKTLMAKTCLSYLCFPSFNQPSLVLSSDGLGDHAFFNYASRHLLGYLDQSEDDDDVHEGLQALFHSEKTVNLINFVIQHIWLNCDRLDLAHETWVDQLCSQDFTTLHAAAMLHLGRICKWLVGQGEDINQVSTLGVPLECALYGEACILSRNSKILYYSDHLYEKRAQETIKIILDIGADCSLDTLSEFCLNYAAERGPTDPSGPFAMLLRHGAPLQKGCWSDLSNHKIIEALETIDQIENANISDEIRIQLLELAQKADHPINQHVPLADIMSDELFFETIEYRVKFGPVKELERLTRDDRFSVDLRCQKNFGTLLHLAAKHNSTDIMRLLLDLGYDPCQCDHKGRTVLHQAAETGMTDPDLLRRLIQVHFSEAEDDTGRTVWHVAAASGCYVMLSILITHYGLEHPCLWQTSENNTTPLLEAIMNRQADCASILIKAPALAKSVTEDWRVLHYTVASGLESFLKEILSNGADPCVMSERKENALHYVTGKTTPEILRLLLRRGVDPNHLDIEGRSPLQAVLDLKRRSADLQLFSLDISDFIICNSFVIAKLVTQFSVHSTDSRGRTAWFYFCAKTLSYIVASKAYFHRDHLMSMLVALLQEGALDAIGSPDNEGGLELLVEMCMEHREQLMNFEEFTARQDKSEQVAKFLHTALFVIEPTKSIRSGPQLVRLLIWSLDKQYPALFKKLLDLQVDVHTPSQFYQGNSPIDFAITKEVKMDMFRSLVNHTSSHRITEVYAKHGLTKILLSLPVKPKHTEDMIEKLELLLEMGVDPNAQTDLGLTSAMIVARLGFVDAVPLLVYYGANLHLKDKYGSTILHHAILSEQVAILRVLQQEVQEEGYWESLFSFSVYTLSPDNTPCGPLPNTTYHGLSLSHLASYTENSDILEYLKEISVLGDVNALTNEGVAPLHFAVCMRSSDTTRWLIDNGADIDMRCGTMQTSALHATLKLGSFETAIALIEAGAKFVKDANGISPEMQIHPSIRAKFLAFLDSTTVSIPTAVFEVLKRDNKVQSDTDLYDAIVSGNLEACRSVILGIPALPKTLESCGTCTPLMVAISQGSPDIAELLLQHGASIDGQPCKRIRGKINCRNTLEMVLQLPQFNDLLETLLERHLEHESHWAHHYGLCRTLQIAAGINLGGLKILIKHLRKHYVLFRQLASYNNQDVNTFIKNRLELRLLDGFSGHDTVLYSGGTAIHVAVGHENSEAIKYLLSLGVRVDTRDKDGQTPLHCAAEMGCTDSVLKLLEHGADPSCTDWVGITPFMTAAWAGKVGVLSTLIRFEPNMESASHEGKSALHYAAMSGEMDAFKYLISVGYDPYKLDDGNKCSPVCYALSHHHLSSYVYASCLDLTHLLPESVLQQSPRLSYRNHASRFLFRTLTRDPTLSCIQDLFDNGSTPLTSCATHGDLEGIVQGIKAGFGLEMRDSHGRTALMNACRHGRLSLVSFLVRQGSILEYTHEGQRITALQAARGHSNIIEWLLVKRWTKQGRITGSAFNSDKRERLWAGIRTVEIPLRGKYERSQDITLLEHAIDLHGMARNGWRDMVPLGWDTVAHLVALPTDL